MDDVDDTALWQRSTAGDGEAFALLFDRHHARVHRHAHRLTADRHDAEDLTAGAFLELWRCRDRVRLVDGSVLPWLLVTTSNLARNHARGLRRYRDFLSRLDREPATTHDVAADEWTDLDEPWAGALAQLSAADLRLVTLVLLEDHPLASAASLLGLTPQAAKSRLHRARQRLRALLPDRHPSTPARTPGDLR
ncbi:RNA polymerase sigma factor [Quadrisphaera granulorum]|uniref:RNA polymerase sigma factor n=1 Tax=Quadrisphaera granulorum TaxID=317664 RepID=UPI001B862345|nr:sigma-70 family RNA polymerase sigma factor [Quadrisphaera granulorum]